MSEVDNQNNEDVFFFHNENIKSQNIFRNNYKQNIYEKTPTNLEDEFN